MRSPEQERTVIVGHYNRYCVRCHGVDGRGVWDMPGVPDFTNLRWQATRSDDQIARIIIQGRGAVMPPFRGTLTLEEAWAMAHYLRTFIPGSEASRPDVGKSEKADQKETLPSPKALK
jgi:mono/diheme cytochrome c family protein